MYLTVKQQVNHLSKEEYLTLRELSHIAKNLTNEALYNIRQTYFKDKSFVSYQANNKALKSSDNYKTLNSNMSQQILKEVDGQFQSFFGLLKKKENGQYDKKVRIPHYLDKDGYATLIIGFVRIKENKLVIPFSNSYRKTHKSVTITIPPNMVEKNIKEVRIIPMYDARFFEIQYTYEVEEDQKELNNNKALAIDLGVNNLATCVTSTGKSFLIDGKNVKSINQWYNKRNSYLQSVKDKQKIEKLTKKQALLAKNRNNKVNDAISKAAKYIVNYCLNNDIGILVLGKNNDFQRSVSLGSRNNQTFVNIPFGKFANKLRYLCQLNGIRYVEQEESYTSKASFWDKDEIPVYDKDDKTIYHFSGRRIKRGLYKTKTGVYFNADVNGALNILRKSNVVSLEGLYDSCVVDTPIRIRIA